MPRRGNLAEWIVSTVPTPLVVLDAEHRIVRVNNAFARTFGINAASARRKPLAEVVGSSWDLGALRTLLRSVPAGSEGITDFEVRAELGDRVGCTLLVDATTVIEPDTDKRRTLLSIRDVTLPRLAEESLRHERDKLQLALKRATEELSAEISAHRGTLEQLRHADRLTIVGRLAAGLAHELGTPLNVVSARAQMICRGQAQGERVAELAKGIVVQTLRMTVLIRRLLDFSRRHGSDTLVHDLGGLVVRTLELLEPLAKKRRVLLEHVLDEPGLGARIDASELQQVLTNLVVNAADAQPDGGSVTVRVHRSERSHPDGSGPASWATVSVSDRGTGVAPEHLPRLFEPFYTTKKPGAGTGLGLSVSHTIVREAGGFITVETKLGAGSTFRVHLPPIRRRASD